MPTTPDNQQVNPLNPNTLITYLPNVEQPWLFYEIPYAKALDEIRSDKYKPQIEALRALYRTDPKAYKEAKVKLPAYCFNGTFTDRVNNNSFKFSSESIGLDLDALVGSLEDHKLYIIANIPSVVCCFDSPSGAGLKVSLRVATGEIKNDKDFKKVFAEAERVFAALGYTVDPSCKDVRRACFISHDPLAYVNLEADILPNLSECNVESVKAPTTPNLPAVTPYLEQETATLTSGFFSVEGEIFTVITNMMLKATDGNRHGVRLAAGRLIGGYISGGLINEAKARDLITTLSDQIAVGGCTSDIELKAIADGIAKGKESPLTIDDFKKANGYNVALFDPAITATKELNLATNAKGLTLATLDNIHQALSAPAFSGYRLGFDTFKDQMMYHTTDSLWQPIDNETPTLFRIELAKLFYKEIPAPLMRDAVNYSSRQNKFDSAQEWLNGLQVWDGVPRVESFNAKYFKTDDNPYTQAVGLYMWTALAARVLDPGCQCDMVVVYEGAQGDGKSSAVAAIAPRIDMATEISFLDDEDKSSRKLQGCVVAEISELRGINTKDEDSIKAFITRRYDRWVPKYKEIAVEIPRRYILIGTTNNREFLGDPTGQRRWLPVSCGKVDVAGIVKDRDQLWAEAAFIYRERGICWETAERLAVDVHEDFMIEDTWTGPIKAYLNTPVLQGLQLALTTAHILYGALKIEPSNQKRCDQMRVAAVLKILGFKRERRMLAGGRIWQWEK